MIKAEDILNATHGGLDIILDCYPQAKDCVNAKKHFAIRDERTPRPACGSTTQKVMAGSGR